MENQKLNADSALRHLKAGYSIYCIIDKKKETFIYKKSLVIVLSENKSLKINEYDFLSLYNKQSFYIEEENQEDAVDTKRDDEYYSWRQ